MRIKASQLIRIKQSAKGRQAEALSRILQRLGLQGASPPRGLSTGAKAGIGLGATGAAGLGGMAYLDHALAQTGGDTLAQLAGITAANSHLDGTQAQLDASWQGGYTHGNATRLARQMAANDTE